MQSSDQYPFTLLFFKQSDKKLNSNGIVPPSTSTNTVQLNEEQNNGDSNSSPSKQRKRSSLPMIDQLIDTVTKNVENDEYFSIPEHHQSVLDPSTSTTEFNGKQHPN